MKRLFGLVEFLSIQMNNAKVDPLSGNAFQVSKFLKFNERFAVQFGGAFQVTAIMVDSTKITTVDADACGVSNAFKKSYCLLLPNFSRIELPRERQIIARFPYWLAMPR